MAKLNEIKGQVLTTLAGGETPKFKKEQVDAALFKIESNIVRQRVLNGEPRIDGRDHKTVRPITVKVGVLPRTHGSALFTRVYKSRISPTVRISGLGLRQPLAAAR